MTGVKSIRLIRIALPSALAGVLVGCGGPAYNPLAPPGGAPATSVYHAAPATSPGREPGPAPELVTLPQAPTPVMGLDNVEVGPEPVLSNAVPVTTGPVPSTPPVMSFGRGWIPLTAWTSRYATGKPERSVSGSTTIYRVPTRSGTCVLTIGSRLAHWNGTPVWLGFAPQHLGGEPHIHALDAEKTLWPLSKAQAVAPAPAKVIVLDPGHGGTDSGTRGAQHQLEKYYTLDWALRTERLLTNAGWKVFLTRRSDLDVSLAERVAFADRVRADLFVSLHFNSASPQTQPAGIETYCLTPSGMPSTLLRGYADDERAVYPNNAFDSVNLEWAVRLHRAVVKAAGANDDGVKRARFMGVLRYQSRPAVLIEGGFLSNPRDCANITSPAYRESLARAVASALQ